MFAEYFIIWKLPTQLLYKHLLITCQTTWSSTTSMLTPVDTHPFGSFLHVFSLPHELQKYERMEASNLGGLYTFCPKYQRDMESSQKSCPLSHAYGYEDKVNDVCRLMWKRFFRVPKTPLFAKVQHQYVMVWLQR